MTRLTPWVLATLGSITASNFRVGTRPEVPTNFYSSMGAWDVLVTEPPHMSAAGNGASSPADTDNQNNLDWLRTLSTSAELPLLIWQTYADDEAPYLGAWPQNRDNLLALAESGVAGVLWDPNAECSYSCSDADSLRD